MMPSLGQASRIMENIETNKFVFQVLEWSLNFTKSGNVLERVVPVKKST